MIKLQNVEKYFADFKALANIDLHVKSGEIFGIIGKSGAGKSSLLRCVNLLEQPTSGKVILEDLDLTSLSANQLRQARQKIGMIFQHFNLLASQTVYANIALPLVLQGESKEKIRETILPLIELTGLADKQDVYPNNLSGGQKQRVAIARALASQPKVLLCDEATSALDPETTRSILSLLKDINQKLGLTILLITHEMEVIKSICDRVALIDKGEIVQTCEVIDFFTTPVAEQDLPLYEAYMQQALPEGLVNLLQQQKQENTHPVLRVYFKGKAASKPIIAHLMQEISLELNILQANIEHLQDQAVGTMVLEIGNCDSVRDQEQIQKGIDYLENQNVIVETLGYVERNAIGNV